MKLVPTLLATGILLSATGSVNATLVSALSGQVVNDTDLNIAWLADANYAKTSGYDADGLMTWNQAQGWVTSLNAENGGQGHLGYNNWRLPTTGPVNGSTFNNNLSYNGSTDYSYNISEQSTLYAGSTGSEMAHLYYNSLANQAFVTPSSAYPSFVLQSGYGLIDDLANLSDESLFTNFQSSNYWSDTGYDLLNGVAWRFDFGSGLQEPKAKADNCCYALAVRTGQVATVPVPAAVWLLGSGLLGLLGVARRKAA